MRNALAATLSFLAILLFLLNSDSNLAIAIRRMAGSPPPQKLTEPHPSSSNLKLTISEKSPATSPPTILVTATNLHQSTSLTLLTWDTPFDEKALLLGIFWFIDLSTDEPLSIPGLKINRVVPPPREAFMEIAPHHAVAKEIVLDGPAAKLEKGREYEVHARGTWKAVWHASVLDVGDDNLKKMGGGTGVKTWDFESNILKIKA